MFTTQQSILVNSSPESVWKLWSDVEKWNTWDHEVEWSRLDGEFKKGATGVLKPAGGPAAKFIMTVCEPFKSFIDVTSLPLAKMSFIHEMEEVGKGIQVTHTVQISGPLSFLFGKVIGERIAKELPKAMQTLKEMAEK